MTQETADSPIDRTVEISKDFKESDSAAGAMSFQGVCGYHTYWKGDEPGDIRYATQTALHVALDEALEELWVDPDMVEREHGEFSPETAAKELELQLEEFFRIRVGDAGWERRFVDAFEDALREMKKTSERQANRSLDEY